MKLSKPKKLTDYRWLNLFEVEFSTRSGKLSQWIFASRKPKPKRGPGPLQADAVLIIPLLKVGRKHQVVLVEEFRVPLGDVEYAFPAGLCEAGETPEAVARRELKEETGLELSKLLYVSPPLASSAGMTDESVIYVVCECEGTPNTEKNEDSEQIQILSLDLDAVRALRSSDKKISSKTFPFLLMFESQGKIAWTLK